MLTLGRIAMSIEKNNSLSSQEIHTPIYPSLGEKESSILPFYEELMRITSTKNKKEFETIPISEMQEALGKIAFDGNNPVIKSLFLKLVDVFSRSKNKNHGLEMLKYLLEKAKKEDFLLQEEINELDNKIKKIDAEILSEREQKIYRTLKIYGKYFPYEDKKEINEKLKFLKKTHSLKEQENITKEIEEIIEKNMNDPCFYKYTLPFEPTEKAIARLFSLLPTSDYTINGDDTEIETIIKVIKMIGNEIPFLEAHYKDLGPKGELIKSEIKKFKKGLKKIKSENSRTESEKIIKNFFVLLVDILKIISTLGIILGVSNNNNFNADFEQHKKAFRENIQNPPLLFRRLSSDQSVKLLFELQKAIYLIFKPINEEDKKILSTLEELKDNYLFQYRLTQYD